MLHKLITIIVRKLGKKFYILSIIPSFFPNVKQWKYCFPFLFLFFRKITFLVDKFMAKLCLFVAVAYLSILWKLCQYYSTWIEWNILTLTNRRSRFQSLDKDTEWGLTLGLGVGTPTCRVDWKTKSFEIYMYDVWSF